MIPMMPGMMAMTMAAIPPLRDMGMNTSDTIGDVARLHIFQVISVKIYTLHFNIIRDKNTTPSFFFYRIIHELYKSCFKIPEAIEACPNSQGCTSWNTYEFNYSYQSRYACMYWWAHLRMLVIACVKEEGPMCMTHMHTRLRGHGT